MRKAKRALSHWCCYDGATIGACCVSVRAAGCVSCPARAPLSWHNNVKNLNKPADARFRGACGAVIVAASLENQCAARKGLALQNDVFCKRKRAGAWPNVTATNAAASLTCAKWSTSFKLRVFAPFSFRSICDEDAGHSSGTQTWDGSGHKSWEAAARLAAAGRRQ